MRKAAQSAMAMSKAVPVPLPVCGSAPGPAASLIPRARIVPHRSSTRGHSDHGWLKTYHSLSFADWWDPHFTRFGALRVLNEDRVAPGTGFPTHPHADFEIWSYVLSGELTHRDSMMAKKTKTRSTTTKTATRLPEEEEEGDKEAKTDKEGAGEKRADADPRLFYRMRRGDVQFTTGGTGIAHSETNEHASDAVHFLQVWALPWRQGLAPRYHTRSFDDARKRAGFLPMLSPLAAGPGATAAQEEEAAPAIPDTIPIHADLVMGAGLVAPGARFEWRVGARQMMGAGAGKDGGEAKEEKGKESRKVFVHVAMTKGGKARVRLDGREEAVLEEGDGAFVVRVFAGDRLGVESVGAEEAEVVVIDTA